MHRRLVSGVACLAVVCTFLPVSTGAHAADLPFPDLATSWFAYRDAVAYLRDRGVIGGYPDGTFKPKETINRAELLKIVFKGRSNAEPVAGSCFSDVTADAWYAPYVCAAKRRGIINGYPDGTFKPGQPVNVAEALKILLRAYGKDIADGPQEKWYEPYARELDRTGVLRRSSMLPWENLTRERASDVIARWLRYDEEHIVPGESIGCGKRPESIATTITVNGMDRSFLLTIPDSYSPRTPVPMIVAFHGRTNSNQQVRAYYELDRTAQNYIIAYPAAIQAESGRFTWSDPSDPKGWVRDVAFFDALVETISDHYCVDLDHLYTVGHSLGAWMANSVACIRGGIVRASATVGGDSVSMSCAGPAAALIIHNPHDTLAAFSGAQRVLAQRTKANACAAEKRTTEPVSLNCEIYTTCDGGNFVQWCPHTIDTDGRGAYYPHQWPDETARAIVDFFEGLDGHAIASAD
jgi:polyhydroxybutyrate depolymerase